MSKLFYKNSNIVGLEIGQKDIKIMSIDPEKWLVLGYGAIDVDEDKMKKSLEKDSEYMCENIKRLLSRNIIGKINSNKVIVNIPTSNSYIRTFNLPIKAKKNLKDAIDLEVSQYIPVSTPLLSIDYEVIKEDKNEITVTMAASPKGIISNVVEACEGANLTLNAIEPKINSVARILDLTEKGNLVTVIVDIGANSTDIAILEDSVVRISGSVSIGGNDLTLAISKKMNVSAEKAHQLKTLNGLNPGESQKIIKSSISPHLQKIKKEIDRVIRYYNERISKKKIEQILIVGGGANLPGIGEYYTNELIMPARVAVPWQNLDFGKLKEPAKQFRPHFISVAGLAITKPEEIWR